MIKTNTKVAIQKYPLKFIYLQFKFILDIMRRQCDKDVSFYLCFASSIYKFKLHIN